MKLCLISDTHGLHDQLDLPEADVLVHSGDLLNRGKLSELNSASLWLQEQKKKFREIVVVAGNHDFILQAFMTEEKEHILRKDFFPGMHYLRDSGVTIDGVNFYGSPWQPFFFNWAFNVQRGPDIKKYWDLIPVNTDVLVTHGPPKNILDMTIRGHSRIGCEELEQAVYRVKPKIHTFGHNHGGYGYKNFNGTEFFNASVVNEAYEVVNKPWIVEI
jgi:Icc-related predicted phosphoesterase